MSCFLARFHAERGQILVMAALLIIVFLGLVGLAVDAGFHFVERRQLQNAADTATMAAAYELSYGGNDAAATVAALENAAANGYDNDGITNTVVVNIPPLSGDYTSETNSVEVIITNLDADTFFIQVLVPSTTQIVGRGVAGTGASTTSGIGILVLNEDDCDTYKQSGSGSIIINNGGGIVVNSGCDPSIRKGGHGDIDVAFIDYYEDGGLNMGGSGSWPPPSPISARVPDPLAALTPPTPGAPAPGSVGTAADPALTHLSGGGTLYPGTYYGGLKLSGSGAWTFMPGIYIMAGGGMNFGGEGSETGSDVLFYNTQNPTNPTGDGKYDKFQFGGNGNVNFTAPTSGPYQNILLWQDPANPEALIHGGNHEIGTGIIYLPGATYWHGGNGSLGAVQLIVDKFEKGGNSDINIDFQNFLAPYGSNLALVE